MFSLNKEKIYQDVVSGSINKLIVLYGIITIILGGLMGGDIIKYIIFLIVIPIILLFLQKKGTKASLFSAMFIVVYLAIIYYLNYPTINTYSYIMYAILILEFYRYFTARELFKN